MKGRIELTHKEICAAVELWLTQGMLAFRSDKPKFHIHDVEQKVAPPTAFFVRIEAEERLG